MGVANRLRTIWKQLTTSGGRIGVGVRYALSQGQPGQWATDHREEGAHFTGWNYVAIRSISTQAAQADVAVYDDSRDAIGEQKSIRKQYRSRGLRKAYGTEANESTPLPTAHPYMRLMARPNPSQSGASQRYEVAMQLLLTGTALIWKVGNKAGRTVERYVVPTGVAFPMPPARDLPRGGWRIDPASSRWQFRDAQGYVETRGWQRAIGQIIPAEDVLVIRFPHPVWKDDGYGALAAGALWIDAGEQVDRARFASMLNGADPSLIITPPDDIDLTEEQLNAAQKKFAEKYCGPNNAKKAMFVTAGRIEKLTTAPKEMDYVAAFTQFRDAIMALHGVPGIAAGITEGGSYAALYASLKQFTLLTVQPILDLIAEEETEQQSGEFGESLTVEYTAASIDDPDVLERQLATDLQAGTRTKGEVRALRGLQPFGDQRDDEIAGAAERTVAWGTLPVRMGDESTTGVKGPPRPGAAAPPIVSTAGTVPAGAGDALPANIESAQALNGAQISAAIEVLAGVTDGTVADTVAIELLIAFGIEETRVRRMVQASKTVKLREPEQPSNGDGFKRHSAVEKLLTRYP